jgi:hypothetical protein
MIRPGTLYRITRENDYIAALVAPDYNRPKDIFPLNVLMYLESTDVKLRSFSRWEHFFLDQDGEKIKFHGLYPIQETAWLEEVIL